MIDNEELSIIGEEIKKDFKVFEDDQQLKNLLTLLLYDEGKTRDTLDLFEILPMESFVKVIKLLNGRRVRFLDFESLERIFKTIILYLEIEIEKKSWKEVIDKYPEWNVSMNRDKYLINNLIRVLQGKTKEIFGDGNE